MKNNIKKLTVSGILLSVGFILHQITPALGGVTFDFLIAILMIIIAINKDDFKIAIIAGIAAGVITALTTKFPGGQIPNIIDKTATVLAVYPIMKIASNMPINIKMGLIGFIGTLISGSVFLSSASILIGLPAEFTVLFISVVLPTSIANTFLSVFLYNIVISCLKKANPALLKQLQG